MNSLVESITTIVLAVIGLAIIATLVSKNANTTGVIQSAASGLANNIGVAESPVSGTSVSLSLGYPSSNTLNYGFGS
jgi:hypothetical protein